MEENIKIHKNWIGIAKGFVVNGGLYRILWKNN